MEKVPTLAVQSPSQYQSDDISSDDHEEGDLIDLLSLYSFHPLNLFGVESPKLI